MKFGPLPNSGIGLEFVKKKYTYVLPPIPTYDVKNTQVCKVCEF